VTTDVLFGYAYMTDEPGTHTEVLAPALRALCEAVGVPPRKMNEFGRKSRHRGERKFSWEWFEEAMGRAEHISLWGGPAHAPRSSGAYRPTELRVRFNLRYFYNIEMEFNARGLSTRSCPRARTQPSGAPGWTPPPGSS
jgi:hypothetical protein